MLASFQSAGTSPDSQDYSKIIFSSVLELPELALCISESSAMLYHRDPTAASILDRDCGKREGETVAMDYKPSPLQVKLEKQRELAQKSSLKNGNMGSPVNQQPKKNNVMARTRLVIPNKGYSSLDQSPDEKPLVALDTDSDDDFDMSRYSSSGYSSAEQINQDLNIQLLKDGYRLDEIPDDEDLDLIPPKSVNPTCLCCQATSSTACHIQ
ncbi:PREDICTED: protein FAM219A-like [Corvus brachyrhynchos]|uniref:protein FAM219A-like n=1 Tax=Corvus brachyrhynchos TaxID=85066 RepID=UPI0004DDF0C0|nr:PREDICTED: protein FAM219A-like [Corvus brachyrhynchos]